MKRFLTASLVVLVSAAAALSGSYSGTATTNAAPALGASSQYNAPAWATATAYSAGERVKSSGITYLVVADGTSVDAPYGNVEFVSGATYRPVLKEGRRALIVQNTGTGILYLDIFGNGVGVELDAGEQYTQVGHDCPAGRIILSSDGSTTYRIFEW